MSLRVVLKMQVIRLLLYFTLFLSRCDSFHFSITLTLLPFHLLRRHFVGLPFLTAHWRLVINSQFFNLLSPSHISLIVLSDQLLPFTLRSPRFKSLSIYLGPRNPFEHCI